MRRAAFVKLIVGVGLAGAVGAQVLGQGDSGPAGATPDRRDGIEAPPSFPVTDTSTALAVCQVFRRGEAPAPIMPVLLPGETFGVRFPTLPDAELDVTFEGLAGPVDTIAARGEAGAELTERVDRLLAARTGSARGFSSIQTNRASPDAADFHAELVRRAGAGGLLPAEDLGFLDASAAIPYRGREVLEAGGVRRIPFVARDRQGRVRATGIVPVAAQASWLYLAGHYTSGGVGGRLAGDPVTPATIEGTGWREHLDVLVLAACSAGKTGDTSRDGADWWLKFEGTLLAYRGTAPTRAASEIGAKLLARVAAAGIRPEDRVEYSAALSRSWMEANLEVGNQMAVAFDSRGNYYLHQTWSSGLPTSDLGGGTFWRNVGTAFARNLPRMVTSRIMGDRYWTVERRDWEREVPPSTD